MYLCIYMYNMFVCHVLSIINSFPLRLETGRFVGEPEYQRIRKMCDSGQVENELHFLLECHFIMNFVTNYCLDLMQPF